MKRSCMSVEVSIDSTLLASEHPCMTFDPVVWMIMDATEEDFIDLALRLHVNHAIGIAQVGVHGPMRSFA